MLPFGETGIEVLERYRISLNNTGSQPGIAEIIVKSAMGEKACGSPDKTGRRLRSPP